jgi:hypothetical protein
MAGLKFRILLDSKDKNEVFRDILISDKSDFESFYRAILDAYGFTSDQMASFYMSNGSWDKGFEISLFDMSFGEDPDQILPGVMNSSVIGDFIQESDQKIILVHDFLRMWIFLIELIEYTEETPEYPKTILAVGNAPAEDSKASEDEDLQFETESDAEGDDEDEDDFGFGDYEDEYDY